VFYVMFGTAISVVAAFSVVDDVQEARLLIAEAATVQGTLMVDTVGFRRPAPVHKPR
jgi:hypothetical protein